MSPVPTLNQYLNQWLIVDWTLRTSFSVLFARTQSRINKFVKCFMAIDQLAMWHYSAQWMMVGRTRVPKYTNFLWIVWKWLFTWSGEKPFGAYLHWYCLRIRARVRVWAPERVLFTLHPRLRFEIIRGHGHLVTCSSDRIKRRFWACVLHNLGRTQMSASKKIATRSDELRHGCPRQKSQTHTRISVNTKHWFTCFDCIWAWTRLLGLRSRM